jgi:transcriptional regulator with PAS, ATPase and Fis domain
VTRSDALNARLRELARIARFDASVLLTGETGTGKSLLARGIHDASPRAGGAFVHVNCGALPESLIEAELFGSVKGAFTGATDRVGRFEAAKGGTLFLDELDSMPEPCQVKLLVALQDRVITPLGSNRSVDVDVRVIGAMNGLGRGGMREDLYFRLAVFPLRIPPLRERPEDVALLARAILDRTSRRYGLPPMRLSESALEQLVGHPWPGNVRELENALDRAALLASDGTIDHLDLASVRAPAAPSPAAPVQSAPSPAAPRPSRAGRRIPEAEFLAAWERADGSAARVAEILGVQERSVYRLKNRYLGDET